jgi:hypothetical protein
MDVWLYLPILGHQGIENQLADTDERTMSYKITKFNIDINEKRNSALWNC